MHPYINVMIVKRVLTLSEEIRSRLALANHMKIRAVVCSSEREKNK